MTTEMVPRVDDLNVNKCDSNYQPSAWRWLTAKPLANKSLIKVVITRRSSTSVYSSSHRSSKTFWSHQGKDGSISEVEVLKLSLGIFRRHFSDHLTL